MLIVIDNFLDTSSCLYKKITHDDSWNVPVIDYGWLDRGATPTDRWSALADKIWRFASELLPSDFEGTEYWGQELGQDVSLNQMGWHQDKDQYLYDSTGGEEVVHPEIGSIYYAHKTPIAEGFLEIQRESENVWDVGGMERIQPIPNRLIIFDSSVFHRVSPVLSGVRRHFATNIWKKKPTEENFIVGASSFYK